MAVVTGEQSADALAYNNRTAEEVAAERSKLDHKYQAALVKKREERVQHKAKEAAEKAAKAAEGAAGGGQQAVWAGKRRKDSEESLLQ